jgi:carbamoyltransferase
MPPKANQTVLGISAFYHDSAACLVHNGEIVAAASEDRFTRKKGDASFPGNAIRFCLEHGGIKVGELDYVGFYDKPLLKFERILETYLGMTPKGLESFLKAGPLWIKDKLYIDHQLKEALGWDGPIYYSEHHESHAASAFFPSPFDEAAILTIDGVGEWATASMGIGRGNDFEILRELHWPDSLGLLYSAFTYFTGFRVNSGEYKVMGLAPYGQPKYKDLILSELMDLSEDGSFRLNQEFFNYLGGLTMTSGHFARLFDGPRREPESELTQREMDLARSVQDVCEEVMLRMAHTIHAESGLPNLCMAGGVALNCVGNGRILREGPFERMWIQPAAGDAGGALGVAMLIWHRQIGAERTPAPRDSMHGAYLGPEFSEDEIRTVLDRYGAVYEALSFEEVVDRSARCLAEEHVVGWFQGRMEFGPRALGARSILGDPRSPRMQTQMNLKIKFRESFRPFAPSVLEERVSDYFEMDGDSPYMLLVAPVSAERQIPADPEHQALSGIERINLLRSDIPAVTHVDYSARVQTVSSDRNPEYYDLIKRFEELTGCGVVINTSFNVRGEPIVCTPDDAYRCFMRTEMDRLVLGSFFLEKDRQPEWKEEGDWTDEFEID